MKLDNQKLRFLLALVVVGGYVVLTGILILAVVFGRIDRENAVEIIEEISKVMAGFMGLVIGYYFSQAQSGSN